MGSIPARGTNFAALADVVIAPVWSTEEWGSIPQGGTKICERGGMVYTADLKSAAFGIEGSSLSSRTKVFLKYF